MCSDEYWSVCSKNRSQFAKGMALLFLLPAGENWNQPVYLGRTFGLQAVLGTLPLGAACWPRCPLRLSNHTEAQTFNTWHANFQSH